ncbi:hypothetical protein [Flammeovirga aprica]|uniref:Uncharacterized protein n=1 Tax=Flammeovirga aprica JL-4 TaxID=694437 RepID=A0A7X9XAC7_9BACT|nr:hypothetical protein [Flammeovirga aprica]NME69494.1 hypothetical protein [Flammeovirga aprica JL-4]
MSFVLMIADRWQSRPLPSVIRYFLLSSAALLSFNTLISQSKSYWFEELMTEQWVMLFFGSLIIEMSLGVLMSRYSNTKVIKGLYQVLSFLPRPTSLFSILIIEILIFDSINGWSFKAVSIAYAISILIIGLGFYFSFRNNQSLIRIKSVVVTVFSILQLLLISTLFNPQKLHGGNSDFDVQSSLFVLMIFGVFALIGYLLSIRKKHGLRK